MKKKYRKGYTRRILLLYDVIIFLLTEVLLLFVYRGDGNIGNVAIIEHGFIALAVVLVCRIAAGCYKEILRYGGVETYIRLMISDGTGFVIYYVLTRILPIAQITFAKKLAIVSFDLLAALMMRMLYRYCYKASTPDTAFGRLLGRILFVFSGIKNSKEVESRNTKVAIFGAGDLGGSLLDDITVNRQFPYEVRCFIDDDWNKSGRQLRGVKVLSWENASPEALITEYSVQEVIVAVRNISPEKLEAIYKRYSAFNIKVKTYDILDNVSLTNGRKQLREVEIEDLLFRKPVIFENEETKAYYSGKTVLVTGGGGSIGSELCRQIAAFGPGTLVVVDIYENTSYELEMEMRMKYHTALDYHTEICSITNRAALREVFDTYHPDIVINAAAHKHVPLMENNPREAIENNVFGCRNLLELTEEYGVGRFMMVSTDKAVNPTNVMGATKRMCEMMVLSHSGKGRTVYSCTRFGNVLGSAGSVIPLFKRQIAAGGPVTITDRRITRYFMTIPEASSLVLESGRLASDGELFVLDMGRSVKIIDLAENMIRLSGARDIEIIETGLRPGEKLYEELLIKSEDMTKTENNLIFIEKDEPLPMSEIDAKLEKLEKAVYDPSLTSEEVRSVLREVVPTYRRPEDVNREYAEKQKKEA